MKKYSAYIFDMDGTLVQSEQLKGKALAEACSVLGKKVNVDIYKDVMGESWEVVTNHFFTEAKLNIDKNKFDKIFNEIYNELIQTELTLTPNVKSFLDLLLQKKKTLAIVSSAPLWTVKAILKKFKLNNYFNVIITREDVTSHKPNPEAYILALSKLSKNSKEVLVFEDSFAGIMAAKKAGCDVIAIRHQFNKKNNLDIAINVISDFNNIKNEVKK